MYFAIICYFFYEKCKKNLRMSEKNSTFAGYFVRVCPYAYGRAQQNGTKIKEKNNVMNNNINNYNTVELFQRYEIASILIRVVTETHSFIL